MLKNNTATKSLFPARAAIDLLIGLSALNLYSKKQ